MGSKDEIRIARRAIKRRLGWASRVSIITERRLKLLRGVVRLLQSTRRGRELAVFSRSLDSHFGLSRGVPTDESLKSLYWAIDRLPPDGAPEPNDSRCGMMYCLPIFPLDGGVVRAELDRVDEVFGKHQFTAYVTLNIISAGAVEAVINLSFDREDRDQVRRAHECIRECQGMLIQGGFIPYRVGIQSMDQILCADDPFWKMVRRLKTVFDPNGIISPGRYNLD
jgi:4-cresol dehydrogenase (hydroxylating)